MLYTKCTTRIGNGNPIPDPKAQTSKLRTPIDEDEYTSDDQD